MIVKDSHSKPSSSLSQEEISMLWMVCYGCYGYVMDGMLCTMLWMGKIVSDPCDFA